jgi:hypothetical protein
MKADGIGGVELAFVSPGPRRPQPTLIDRIANPETKFYSGEAVYTRDFTLVTFPTKPVLLEIEWGTAISPQPLAQPEATQDIPNPLVTRTGLGMRAWYDPPFARPLSSISMESEPASSGTLQNST